MPIEKVLADPTRLDRPATLTHARQANRGIAHARASPSSDQVIGTTKSQKQITKSIRRKEQDGHTAHLLLSTEAICDDLSQPRKRTPGPGQHRVYVGAVLLELHGRCFALGK